MTIIGIDPGSILCGYGVVRKDGTNLSLIEYGVIEAKKKNPDFHMRLKEIFDRLTQVVERNQPDAAAFEAMFYAKNAQSLIKLSHARSAAMIAVLNGKIPISEYSAKEVKKSVTGRGAASKEQVQYMVKTILSIEETPQFFDATDALAVAICHSVRYNEFKSGSSSWADFARNNPDLIVKH